MLGLLHNCKTGALSSHSVLISTGATSHSNHQVLGLPQHSNEQSISQDLLTQPFLLLLLALEDEVSSSMASQSPERRPTHSFRTWQPHSSRQMQQHKNDQKTFFRASVPSILGIQRTLLATLKKALHLRVVGIHEVKDLRKSWSCAPCKSPRTS